MSKVGINGFGRIGRLVLRRLLEVKSNIDVVAINDLTSPKILAYLLKHDSNYGPFPWSVDFTEDSLIVDGKSIAVYAEKEAKEGANKRGNTSRLTQSFHFFMFEPIFSPVNALNQPI